MTEFSKRLVCAINEKLETGKAMNALSHAMFGFAANMKNKKEGRFNKYVDADGSEHNNISEMPNVVLRAGSNKIRKLRQQAIEKGIEFVDFTDTMSIGTYDEEYELMRKTKDEHLEYWAIVLFGDATEITDRTGKLSLYR